MNGPSHYREAERLLNAIDGVTTEAINGRLDPTPAVRSILAGAQVHATLALAAATARASADDGDDKGDRDWWTVIS